MTAAWTANRSWIAGEIVSAALMNQYVRDNLDWLKTPTANAPATFATNFTTTSATLVDVTGMTATLTSNGGGFEVHCDLLISHSSTNNSTFDILVDGVAESGLTLGLATYSLVANAKTYMGLHHHITAKAAGSHTIKLQCLTGGGTLTIYGTTGVFSPYFYVKEDGA